MTSSALRLPALLSAASPARWLELDSESKADPAQELSALRQRIACLADSLDDEAAMLHPADATVKRSDATAVRELL